MRPATNGRLSLAVLIAFISSVSLLQAGNITFDPPLEPGGITPLDEWLEQDMWFTGPSGFSQYDSGCSRVPDNGTAYLHFASGPRQTLTFKFLDSTPFTLVSVDLAEYSTLFAKPQTVRFDCHKLDGTVQFADFVLDGLIDGPGGISEFETFTFGPEFTDIISVEVPTTGYSMDNVAFEKSSGYETLIGLEITGPNSLEETVSEHYEAIAFFQSGNTLNVTSAATWTLDPNTHASIYDSGVLSTQDINEPQDVTVYAEYSQGQVTLRAEILVHICLHTPRRLHIPEQYDTIQMAIDNSLIGDEIIVHPGRYYENISLLGKRITVRSDDPTDSNTVACTIIDGAYGGSVVIFSGEELPDCVLSGFTITNGGSGALSRGAGIYGNGTLATIEHNVITGNQIDPSWMPSSAAGGGLYDCDGIIRHNVISENRIRCDEGASRGAGLYGCDGTICHNLILNNEALGLGSLMGGGFYNCNGYIANNTIIGNYATEGGAFSNCSATIKNCIIWNNSSSQIHETPNITYSDIQGGCPGSGNVYANPRFANPNSGDYHLKSQAGRWDANEGQWVLDEMTSPCIDAGDPMSPIGLEMFPNGGHVNMGAYGGTAQASRSWFGGPVCETIVPGDVNGDCRVNFLDFRLMALHWYEDNSQ